MKSLFFVPALAVTHVLFGTMFTSAQPKLEIAPWYLVPSSEHDTLLAAFEGRVPGVGSQDLKTKVGLALRVDKSGKPASYLLRRVFVGLEEEARETRGTWSFQRGIVGYPDATVIALDQNIEEDWRYYWLVNDDIVLPLDATKRPKAGNAAWGYMLSGVHRQ